VPDCDAKQLLIDVTPVDYASDVIAQIVQKDDKQDCYHIANDHGFSLQQITKILDQLGVELATLSKAEWQEYPQTKPLSKAEQAAWLGLCRALGDAQYQQYRSTDLFQGTNIQFDQTRLKAILPHSECPKASDDLCQLYLQRILQK